MSWLANLFSTPARQALGWTLLGILGVIFAATGAWLLLRDGSAPPPPAAPAPSGSATLAATPTPVRTPSPVSSPSATATATPTPTPTPSPRPASGGGTTGGQSGAPAAPTPTPTEAPVVRAYCPPASVGPGTLPTARVAGRLTRGGVPVPAGSVEVFVAFDGVPGPSRLNVDEGFGIDFYAGGEACANRVGAVIGVIIEGHYFPSPYTVGSQPALVVINVDLP